MNEPGTARCNVSESVVCVVDNDEDVCRGLRRLLKAAGFLVETFTSAQSFLDRAWGVALGVVVVDVRMPVMNGLELQAQLTQRGCPAPLMFMTAHDDERIKRAALDAGAVAFLHKPFEEEGFISLVTKAMRNRAACDWEARRPVGCGASIRTPAG